MDLPDEVSDELGASLGDPGITAHRALFADGFVAGQTVLVHGVLGAVGSLAGQLARWQGATVIGTVRRQRDCPCRLIAAADHVIALDEPGAAAAIRQWAPNGVDRIVEVSLSDNIELDAAVSKVGTVIAAYASRDDRPHLPFWPLLFDNVTLRLLGSDDFPVDAKLLAAGDLTATAQTGALHVPTAQPVPLAEIAAANDRVDRGTRERVLVAVDT